MKIPQEKLDEIARANDIIDVISSYTSVKKRGKSFLALCPFHPDKNPSLTISQEKQVYHCFACGASGNVFSFVRDYEKITFMEAAEKLARKAGIDLNLKKLPLDVSNEISRLFEINKKATAYFNNNLLNIQGAEREFILSYLDKRKIKRQIIEKFYIGYAYNDWNNLLNYFIEDNIFSPEDVQKAGLIIQNENEKDKYYDRFRGRLVFPIFSENDKVVGFGARKLFDDDPGGKYINSPETKIYNKSRILYGLNFAKNSIREKDYAILVEGYMDLISLFQSGITNVVASSGTALTEEQVRLLSRYTKSVVLIFDADIAGIKAAKRGIEIILEAGLDINVVSLPEGEDPDSIIRLTGKEEFEKYLNNYQSIIDFISQIYEKEGKLSNANERTAFVREIIGFVSKIPDKLKRAFYIKEICNKYNLQESDLRDELNYAMSKTRKNIPPKTSVLLPDRKVNNKKSNKELTQMEKELFEVFIHGDSKAIEYLERNFEIKFLKNKITEDIVVLFLNEYIDHGEIDVSRIMNKTENEEIKSIISGLTTRKHEMSKFENQTRNTILEYSEKKEINYLKIAEDIIIKFKIHFLERKINELKTDAKNINEVLDLKREINNLTKKK